MAITSQVKEELLAEQPENSEAVFYETVALLRLSSTITSCLDDSGELQIVFRCDFDTIDVAKRLEKNIKLLLEKPEEVEFTYDETKKGRKVIFISGNVQTIGYNFGIVSTVGQVIKGLPSKLVYCPSNYLTDALRGAFLARSVVIEPEKSALIEIYTPNIACAMGVSGLLRRAGIKTNHRPVRNHAKVIVKDWDDANSLFDVIHTPKAKQLFTDQKKMLDMSANANRVTNFDYANLERVASAAVKTTQKMKWVLDLLGEDKIPDNLLSAAKLRMKHDSLSLDELAQLSTDGVTKHALAGRLRRLFMMATKYAKTHGIEVPRFVG